MMYNKKSSNYKVFENPKLQAGYRTLVQSGVYKDEISALMEWKGAIEVRKGWQDTISKALLPCALLFRAAVQAISGFAGHGFMAVTTNIIIADLPGVDSFFYFFYFRTVIFFFRFDFV